MRNTLLATAFTCFSILSVSFIMNHADAKESASTVPYDAKFLDQFSEHHGDAIKMGEMATSKAANPEVKKIAEKMVSDQTEEIKKMKEWREKISSAPPIASSMPKMDMSSLNQKNGRDFDIAFLDMMAKHHQQGVSMAKEASAKLSNPEVKTFAKNAAEKQDHERQKLLKMKKSESSDGTMTK